MNPIYKDEESDELALEGQTIDLLCPFNRQVMKIPCRGLHCTHRKCFDLECYIVTNGYECRFWKCPHCNRKTSRLYVDKFIEHIIKIAREEKLLKNYSVRLEKNGTKVEFQREEFSDESDLQEPQEEPERLKDLKLITFNFDPLLNSFYSPELDRHYQFEEGNQVKGEDSSTVIEKTKGELKTKLHYREQDGVILISDSDEEPNTPPEKNKPVPEEHVLLISDSEGNQKSNQESSPAVDIDKGLQLVNLFRSRLRNLDVIGKVPDSFIPEYERKASIVKFVSLLHLEEPTYSEMSTLQGSIPQQSITDETPEDQREGLQIQPRY